MEKDREISEEEYDQRYRYKLAIEKDHKLKSLPRMFDFYSNGWVSVDRARPREDKIRLVVSSTLLVNKEKTEKYDEQICVDVSVANAKRVGERLLALAKKYEKKPKKRAI